MCRPLSCDGHTAFADLRSAHVPWVSHPRPRVRPLGSMPTGRNGVLPRDPRTGGRHDRSDPSVPPSTPSAPPAAAAGSGGRPSGRRCRRPGGTCAGSRGAIRDPAPVAPERRGQRRGSPAVCLRCEGSQMTTRDLAGERRRRNSRTGTANRGGAPRHVDRAVVAAPGGRDHGSRRPLGGQGPQRPTRGDLPWTDSAPSSPLAGSTVWAPSHRRRYRPALVAPPPERSSPLRLPLGGRRHDRSDRHRRLACDPRRPMSSPPPGLRHWASGGRWRSWRTSRCSRRRPIPTPRFRR